MTNLSEMTRIGRPPNLCQFGANPWHIYQCADIDCQFPANQTQRNLTAHRQVWASNLGPEPSGNWVLANPEKLLANPSQSSANLMPINNHFQLLHRANRLSIAYQSATNALPIECLQFPVSEESYTLSTVPFTSSQLKPGDGEILTTCRWRWWLELL